MAMAAPVFTNKYSQGLFGCFDDMGVCMYGFFCTPCLIGQSSQDAGVGPCYDTAACLLAWNLIPYCGSLIALCKEAEAINKAANAFQVQDQVDFCTMLFCGACAACRLQIEINKRKAAGMQPVQNVAVIMQPAQPVVMAPR